MDRIRQLRKERALSQVKLAVMADMDPATLNRLEQGKGNPNLKTLERVADALGVEVGDFFPKAQSALFQQSDDSPVGRGADEAVAKHARALNEVLHKMQQAYAPGRELDWSRDSLEELSALVAKVAISVAAKGLDTGGRDAFVEAVQVLGRADQVVRLLDERAADASTQTAGPLSEKVVQLNRELKQFRPPEQRAG